MLSISLVWGRGGEFIGEYMFGEYGGGFHWSETKVIDIYSIDYTW